MHPEDVLPQAELEGTGTVPVELRGVEPLASSMRPRRSSQLSYSPEGNDHDSPVTDD